MQLRHEESAPKGPDGNRNGTESMPQQQPSPSASTQTPQTTADLHPPPADLTPEDMPPAEPALMHFPHCRLEIHTLHGLPASPAGAVCKLEQVALPGALVRTLLSRFESEMEEQTRQLLPPQTQAQAQAPSSQPQAPSHSPQSLRSQHHHHQQQQQQPPPRVATKRERRVRIQPHFDDAGDWVFSRCLLADFTSLRDDEAEALSAQGRLCCWASVVLRPSSDFYSNGEGEDEYSGGNDREEGGSQHGSDERGQQQQEEEEEEELWELGFVVHRVGIRDPRGGWCGCF